MENKIVSPGELVAITRSRDNVSIAGFGFIPVLCFVGRCHRAVRRDGHLGEKGTGGLLPTQTAGARPDPLRSYAAWFQSAGIGRSTNRPGRPAPPLLDCLKHNQ